MKTTDIIFRTTQHKNTGGGGGGGEIFSSFFDVCFFFGFDILIGLVYFDILICVFFCFYFDHFFLV